MRAFTCDDVRDRLPDHVVDRLGVDDAACMESHIAACTECRSELDLIVLLTTSPVPLPAGFEQRLVAATRTRPSRSWNPGRLAMAATVVFALVSAGVISRTGLLDRAPAGPELNSGRLLDWTKGDPVVLRGGLDLGALSDDELVKLLEEMDS
jgi:hypothetical protein